MHRAVDLGREVEPRVLLERQRVHVATEQDGGPGPAALDHRDHGGERFARPPLETELPELLDHDRLGDRDLGPDLRMAMDPAPDRDDVVVDRPGGVEETVEPGRRSGGFAKRRHIAHAIDHASSSSARFGASHRAASSIGRPFRAA